MKYYYILIGKLDPKTCIKVPHNLSPVGRFWSQLWYNREPAGDAEWKIVAEELKSNYRAIIGKYKGTWILKFATYSDKAEFILKHL